MIMDDIRSRLTGEPVSSFGKEGVALSFDSYKFSGSGGGGPAAGTASSSSSYSSASVTAATATAAAGREESGFDETLNTPRTATSDGHFSFVRSQIEMTQEALPIIAPVQIHKGIKQWNPSICKKIKSIPEASQWETARQTLDEKSTGTDVCFVYI